MRLRAKTSPEPEVDVQGQPSWMSQLGNTLASALGFPGSLDQDERPAVDYREAWDRFQSAFEGEMSSNDGDLMDMLTASLKLARAEWGSTFDVKINRLELGDQLPAFDLAISHANGLSSDTRIFLCNKPTQGGGLKRQLDKVLQSMGSKSCTLLRASDFPQPGKNQTGQAMGKFRTAGGRTVMVPISEWERMLTVSQFHADHRQDPGFQTWFETARLLSGIHAISRILEPPVYVAPAPVYVQQPVYIQPTPVVVQVVQVLPTTVPVIPNAPTVAAAPVAPVAPSFPATITTTSYVVQQPVYVQPTPIYVSAPPVYVAPLYAPAPVISFGFGFGHYGGCGPAGYRGHYGGRHGW